MTDSKYFATTKKGEMYELKEDLHSENKNKKKDAVKKVIASMTVGKDVSQLFADVINCMQTDNLELKKLVYLYLMNYAKSQPDMAILAVNTFVRDCEDPNPLIRALAVRTMGCIRVDKITEYLCEPLRKCLKDEDPYVRKTAAVCVAKLFDINQNLVKEQGFLDALHDLLTDSNPMVVANAVAALAEIGEVSGNFHDYINESSVNKLLTALNECTEWGQIFILDALSQYTPKDASEAQRTCERVTPRLQHANAAVVLSAIKVLMKYGSLISDEEYLPGLYRKLAPPLVTLLSAEPEVQYVALRNINLVVQKMPEILRHEIKVFFVKYNDPIYVKLEKLDILIRLASQSNITQVLAELKEYSAEVDVDFVRKAVRAIGRCAIKVEGQSEKCVSTLLELIKTKVNYVVQEAIVVIKDIFRKYPNRYESIIAALCENLASLDEPEARAAMVWILGEYAERIDNADELLDGFLEVFHDEAPQVQLQLITAIVKMFLKKPTETQDLVQRALSLATQDSDNPDLRDRGYIYWRLLSTDPAAAREVVLAERPLIAEETDLLEPQLLKQLITHISSLASVYHKPPNTFLEPGKGRGLGTPDPSVDQIKNLENIGGNDDNKGTPKVIGDINSQQDKPEIDFIGDILVDITFSSPDKKENNSPAPNTMSKGLEDLLDFEQNTIRDGNDILGTNTNNIPVQSLPDIMGLDLNMNNSSPVTQGNNDANVLDIFGISSSASNNSDLNDILGNCNQQAQTKDPFVPNYKTWMSSQNGKGLEVEGTFSKNTNNQTFMHLKLTNKVMAPFTNFALQYNKNSFGVVIAEPMSVNQPLQPNTTTEVKIKIDLTGVVQKTSPLNKLQVAIKNNAGVSFWECFMPVHIFFIPDGKMEMKVFVNTWKELPTAHEKNYTLDNWGDTNAATNKFKENSVFMITSRNIDGQELDYYSIQLTNKLWILVEVRSPQGQITIKCKAVDICDLIFESLNGILK